MIRGKPQSERQLTDGRNRTIFSSIFKRRSIINAPIARSLLKHSKTVSYKWYFRFCNIAIITNTLLKKRSRYTSNSCIGFLLFLSMFIFSQTAVEGVCTKIHTFLKFNGCDSLRFPHIIQLPEFNPVDRLSALVFSLCLGYSNSSCMG